MPDDGPLDALAAIYHPRRARSFAADECFLCGAELDSRNRSDEHVIPKWVLTEFDLWNEALTLLNGTTIPYRQLVVPCCSTCNEVHLSKIEKQVRDAYTAGYEAFEALDRSVLFLWLAKIVYGVLVRELFLVADRSRPDDGSIVDPEVLREFRLHHLLLQAARGVVSWSASPASIILFRTKTTDTHRLNFDLADSVIGPSLSVRLGGVGILSMLQDWGSFEQSRYVKVERVRGHALAPLQFRELMSFARYMATKYRSNPTILVLDHVGGKTHVLRVGSPNGEEYEPVVPKEWAELLASDLGLSIEDVWIEGQVMSWLTTSDGQPLDAPFNAVAGPPA